MSLGGIMYLYVTIGIILLNIAHVTEKERELYEREIDHKILMDKEFLEWYETIMKK